MLPPDWAELAPLLDAVLDAAPEERAALITQLSQGDRAREEMLARLVADCERDTPLLDGVAAERFDTLASEAATPLLPEMIGDRYRTGRELGSGGMARVYLARDLKHGRDVAIKVIRSELSASMGHDRFLREIEIAARLRHPNIVPLYDSGEIDGSLYFVMPYEEGPSLRQRLEAEPLSVPDALNVLRDVARALAYAHEHGVVHRDVKPDNVMLSGGAAVVTDFGIAKALSAALTDPVDTTLTQAGSGIGTPAYMAPEQATGDPSTDHRADLYSFGCLAYAVFTGRPPFEDRSLHLVIAAHLSRAPRRVNEFRADVPPAVAELIAHCLQKAPDDRPQSAREVLSALESAATTGLPGAAPTDAPAARRSRPLVWAGLALILLLGALAYVTSHKSHTPAPISLAVLPFGNMSADSAMTYVAEGLADELAAALARVPGIQVKSRSGARAYRGQLGPDVTEAGARLDADYLITGAVREDRGHWILSAELTRAVDKASLWGDKFNLGAEQQAAAADSIANRVVAGMQGLFPRAIGRAPALASNQRTSNSEAYRLYLRGQEKLDRRGRSVKESAELFRQAIHQDTTFARAYSGLSMSLALFPYFQAVPPRDVNDEVITAARRALALDSTLAQPYVALALVDQYNYQWDRALADLQTAVRLDGRNVEARVQLARCLLSLGRNTDAASQLRAARAVDPASALVLSWMAYTYFLLGKVDSALLESSRALENDSTNLSASGLRVRVLIGANRFAEARKYLDRVPRWDKLHLLARLGNPDEARQGLQELEAQSPEPWLANSIRALGYLGLRDTAQALTALERATDEGELWPSLWGLTDPFYDPIRGSARFRALERKVGLGP